MQYNYNDDRVESYTFTELGDYSNGDKLISTGSCTFFALTQSGRYNLMQQYSIDVKQIENYFKKNNINTPAQKLMTLFNIRKEMITRGWIGGPNGYNMLILDENYILEGSYNFSHSLTWEKIMDSIGSGNYLNITKERLSVLALYIASDYYSKSIVNNVNEGYYNSLQYILGNDNASFEISDITYSGNTFTLKLDHQTIPEGTSSIKVNYIKGSSFYDQDFNYQPVNPEFSKIFSIDQIDNIIIPDATTGINYFFRISLLDKDGNILKTSEEKVAMIPTK